jgi:hypothetical protein
VWIKEVEGRFVLVAVALLGKGTAACYLVLLRAIREWIRNNFGKQWAPTAFFTDFDLAIRSAIDQCFRGRRGF